MDELLVWLRQRIIDEQNSLAEDDPTGNCAASHRGAINAYETTMRHIQHMKDVAKLAGDKDHD